jgi:hypothetical protein
LDMQVADQGELASNPHATSRPLPRNTSFDGSPPALDTPVLHPDGGFAAEVLLSITHNRTRIPLLESQNKRKNRCSIDMHRHISIFHVLIRSAPETRPFAAGHMLAA